jgi:putative endonuclease
MRVKDAVGRFGEDVAAEHLEAAGLQILARNWRCHDGEIDVVARDGAAVVFVEVKTRSSLAYGSPAEAVDRRKSTRVRRLGVRWLLEQREAGGDEFWSSVRFDVVTVVRTGSAVRVEHLRGAF